MSYSNTFLALLNEAQFTKEILGIGATQIRKANYAKKGIYYQSFTCLSTGLERIGKMCILLDYYINSDGGFPDLNYVKNKIGHDIGLIYKESLSIAEKRMIDFDFLKDLNGEIHQNILSILSDYAKGDRYSNINILLGSQLISDSMKRWYETVDTILFEKHVTKKKKERLLRNAEIIHQLTEEFTLVRHIAEDGKSIESVKTTSFKTGMQESIAVYRQLYILQIIRFWVELVIELQYKAMQLGKHDIPHLSEI